MGKNVEPVKKRSLRNMPASDSRLQVTIGSSNHANIRSDRSSSTDTFEFMFPAKHARGAIWVSAGSSPTSSRKIVPPSASSKSALRVAELAPVKAPFSWPNNSDAIKSRGIAAQFKH